MTVKHLQSVQRQQLNMALQTDPTVIHKFKTGFMECAEEVNRYVGQLEGVDDTVRQRLNNHLNNCATGLEQIGSMTNFSNGYRSGAASILPLHPNTINNNGLPLTLPSNGALFPSLTQDLNNNSANGAIQMGGVQLIPSRLPSGEFALIVPNTNNNTNNNNNNAATTFPNWNTNLHCATNSSTQINDFAANFKRLSAFSKPSQHSLITPARGNTFNNNYPQSNNNLSSLKTYQPINQQQATLAPPATTAFHTSTTTSPPLSPISSVSSHNEDSIMHTSSDSPPRQDKYPNNFSGVFASPPSSTENSFVLSSVNLQQQQVSSTSNSDLNTSSSFSSLKRSFSETADSSICSEDEPSTKKYQKEQQQPDNEDHDSMWRPW